MTLLEKVNNSANIQAFTMYKEIYPIEFLLFNRGLVL